MIEPMMMMMMMAAMMCDGANAPSHRQIEQSVQSEQAAAAMEVQLIARIHATAAGMAMAWTCVTAWLVVTALAPQASVYAAASLAPGVAPGATTRQASVVRVLIATPEE